MKKTQGFSLIELLIAVTIMSILGAIALTSFSTIRRQARDQLRKQELNQYKTALEANYADNASYPVWPSPTYNETDAAARSDQSQAIFEPGSDFLNTYMANKVLVGVNASDNFYYYYRSDTTKYKLWGTMDINGYFEICSGGKSGYTTTVNEIKTDCDI